MMKMYILSEQAHTRIYLNRSLHNGFLRLIALAKDQRQAKRVFTCSQCKKAGLTMRQHEQPLITLSLIRSE